MRIKRGGIEDERRSEEKKKDKGGGRGYYINKKSVYANVNERKMVRV